MAPLRTYWKGHLRLSLVTIEVALYSAAESGASLSLRQIHKPSGKRVRYEKVAEGVGPVRSEDIVKGFEIADDEYVVLEPHELDEIKLDSSRAIRLVQFVDQAEVDPRYFEKPYYLTPQGEAAAEGFVVIREALRRAKKLGLGQMTMRGRESLIAVRPCGKGLLLETLRYGEELRKADGVFGDIPEIEPDEDMLGLAAQLIEQKTAAFDASAFSDSYAKTLRELIERKRRGRAIVSIGDKPPKGGGEVVDLMEALRKSLGESRSAAKPAARGGRAKPTSQAKTASRSGGARATKAG